MKRTVKKTMKRYANGGSSLDTRPVQNAPKVTITPKKPVSKAEAPKPKPTSKPTPKPAPKPAVKPVVKPVGVTVTKPTPKPTPKPASKPAAKPTAKPAAKPAAKPTAKPAAKPVTKPAAKPAAKPTYSAVKDIKSEMYPNTGVPKPGIGVRATTQPKPTAKPTPKPATKTVSQVWAEKTGTSWSEAKKLGLTDGSAKSNLALLDKLNKGTVSKSSIADMKTPSKPAKEETIPTLSVKGTTVSKSNASPSTSSSTSETTPKPSKQAMSGSGLGASERMEGMYKRGGLVKKKMKLKKK